MVSYDAAQKSCSLKIGCLFRSDWRPKPGTGLKVLGMSNRDIALRLSAYRQQNRGKGMLF